nr:unnamed protein product [Callosobruchus analis]
MIHPWTPQVLIYESPFALPSGLLGVQSAMAVRAAPTLFLAGRLRLRCRARLLGLYDCSEQLDVQEDAPQLALVMVHDVTAAAQTVKLRGI